jgi:hypothetical protein
MIVNKTSMFRYQGRSMWPCFQEGDLLEYESCSFQDIRPGDCVVYLNEDNQYATHRVLVKNSALITRGDAFTCTDKEPIQPEKIVGKVVRRYRLGRGTNVAGGFSGLLVSCIYRYAGRIDPQRNARGGKLARYIRSVSMVVFRLIWVKGHQKTLLQSNDKELTVWVLGSESIGKKDNLTGEWVFAWPWSILFHVINKSESGFT